MSPVALAGSYMLCRTRPMAWPIGVVVPYAQAMSHGLKEEGGKRLGIKDAIRDPSAKPSNVWWKEIATRRTMNDVPVATLRAMPMKMLWKRMPASRRRHCRSCL